MTHDSQYRSLLFQTIQVFIKQGKKVSKATAVRVIISHLSKWPSDLKINGTQENITFSGSVFHGLSCGVFLFVASVSFKNHPLNGWKFSTANQLPLFYGF